MTGAGAAILASDSLATQFVVESVTNIKHLKIVN
jgi:hypothetical protein